jgi:hypothetical protein
MTSVASHHTPMSLSRLLQSQTRRFAAMASSNASAATAAAAASNGKAHSYHAAARLVRVDLGFLLLQLKCSIILD